MKSLYIHQSSSTFSDTWSLMKKEIAARGEALWQDQVGWVAYVFWWCVEPDPFLRSGPKEYNCLEADEEVILTDLDPELK